MAYTINIGTTSKKRNSTSQSFVIRVNSASCLLKKPSSIKTPVFTYQGAFPEDANYFYVSEWAKYFWLTDAIFTEGHWEFSGKCDVLATYKAEIGGGTQYVARSASSWDNTIPDGMCIPTGVTTSTNQVYNLGFNTTGTYIVGVASSSGTIYYACDLANFKLLYTDVFSGSFLESILQQFVDVLPNITVPAGQTVANSFYNSIVDPGQYIQSAIWIPFTVGGNLERIYLGITPTTAYGKPVALGSMVSSVNYTIDLSSGQWVHPQAGTLGPWVMSNIGRRLSLMVPGIGDINIDLANSPGNMQLFYDCDIFGTVTFVCRHSGQCIVRTGTVAAQVGIANISTNISGALTSIGSSIGSALAGNPLMAAHGIFSGFSNSLPHVETISTGNSRSIAAQPVIVVSMQFTGFKDCHITRQGKPLCQAVQIDTLSGYIECSNADVLCAALGDEKQEINNYLNGGFYYE